ncbi:MAG TPA: DUF302 domain-containing protein [Candidatus Acidoferrales bacterium]|nr:DUF302 domain-containing protein [Candidatus Acidoferrales bacterium]
MPSNLSTSTSCGYGDVRIVRMPFDDAVARIEGALKDEGFGALCQIDIQAKLKEKLGIDFPKYVILGACNPPLALQALQRDIHLGLLLPCNAVVYEEGNQVHVGVVDAVRMLSVANHPEMEGLAQQVNEKLRRALDSVAPRPAP